MMRCMVCGTDLLVRDTPFWGMMCHACFERRYFEYRQRMFDIREYVFKQIIADILQMNNKDAILKYIRDHINYMPEIESVLECLWGCKETPISISDMVYLVINSDEYYDLRIEGNLEGEWY